MRPLSFMDRPEPDEVFSLELLFDLAQPWRQEGACVTSPEPGADWFPAVMHSTAAQAAVRTCRRCPVAQECLDYALTQDDRAGIWGGLSPTGRWDHLAARGDTPSYPRRAASIPGPVPS